MKGSNGHGHQTLSVDPLVSFDVIGTSGNDALVSAKGQLSADGGAGNDLLYGFVFGNGGDGDDSFWFGRQQESGDPQITYDGGNGIDRVVADFQQETQLINVDLAGAISYTPAPIKLINIEQLWINASAEGSTHDVTFSTMANGNTLIDAVVTTPTQANHFYFEAVGPVPEIIWQPYDGMAAYW